MIHLMHEDRWNPASTSKALAAIGRPVRGCKGPAIVQIDKDLAVKGRAVRNPARMLPRRRLLRAGMVRMIGDQTIKARANRVRMDETRMDPTKAARERVVKALERMPRRRLLRLHLIPEVRNRNDCPMWPIRSVPLLKVSVNDLISFRESMP